MFKIPDMDVTNIHLGLRSTNEFSKMSPDSLAQPSSAVPIARKHVLAQTVLATKNCLVLLNQSVNQYCL